MEDERSTPYRGNCHCGRYRFELSLPGNIKTAMACTCSLCVVKGYLWIMPPEGSFRVIRDDGRLQEYTSKAMSDKFCSHCGTGVLGQHLYGPMRGQKMVNVRALQGVNPFQLDVTTIETDVITETDTTKTDTTKTDVKGLAPEPPKPLVFSCHCGNLRAELDHPIQEYKVKEDNCSLCVRNAYIGVYPTKDQVTVHGREHGFEYYGIKAEATGRKWSSTVHCKTCGVFVLNVIYGPPLSIFDKLAPDRKAHALEVYYKNTSLLPLNVRALRGSYESIDIQRSDEGTEGYEELLDPWRGEGVWVHDG
ncbi:hypothetical protein G6O67_007848 [Ophiocordyceps sinensis]|uniref:CENP-V/GFA domain-containing protein n=1 Tax=Ophiocordyceps sinensis TaxID=72228 RepID=A0A8H4LUP4_9HYPO|nr:hypothetical protein G6O67_007848 [Ophiocordyceps sinensis]